MVATVVELDEAAGRLIELVAKVEDGGEVVITSGSKPVARLVAYQQSRRRIEPGSARGLLTLAEDWDAPLDDFNEYTR